MWPSVTHRDTPPSSPQPGQAGLGWLPSEMSAECAAITLLAEKVAFLPLPPAFQRLLSAPGPGQAVVCSHHAQCCAHTSCAHPTALLVPLLIALSCIVICEHCIPGGASQGFEQLLVPYPGNPDPACSHSWFVCASLLWQTRFSPHSRPHGQHPPAGQPLAERHHLRHENQTDLRGVLKVLMSRRSLSSTAHEVPSQTAHHELLGCTHCATQFVFAG